MCWADDKKQAYSNRNAISLFFSFFSLLYCCANNRGVRLLSIKLSGLDLL